MPARRILALANLGAAGLFGLITLASLAAVALGVVAILSGQAVVWEMVFALAMGLLAAGVSALLVVTHLKCAQDALASRYRGRQTILAALYVPLCLAGLVWAVPALWIGEAWLAALYMVTFVLGIAYALYALWHRRRPAG